MEQDREPYLVFTRNRPHRVALIVDIGKASAIKDITSLMNDASTKWGGRFFQIIPAKNGSVPQVWVDHLGQYDPDLIHTFCKLNKSTIKRISTAANPYAFMQENRFMRIPSSPDDPIDVLPDAISTSRLWRNPISQPDILSFDYGQYGNEGPRFIVNFIKANFGSMPQDLSHIKAIEGSGAKQTILPARTKAQFIRSLNTLDEWNRRIYPNEYSMLPGLTYEVHRDRSSDVTSLYIGDSPLDLILYWNDAISRPDWLSTQKNQIWVPTKFLDNPEYKDKIKAWLSKFARQLQSNSDVRDLKLISSSVSQQKLEQYKTELMSGTSIHPTIERTSKPAQLVYSGRITTTSDMESFSVSGDKYTIGIPEVNVMQGGMGGQKWMTDVLVERKDQNDYRRPLKEYWLQLPRDNNLAQLQVGYNNGRVGRINRDGILSMPLNRDKDTLRFTGTIPEMDSITQTLIIGERNGIHYNGDLREHIEKRPYVEIANSVAGRSLRGAIHLFGGLSGAAQFFETSFWRDIFMVLAGANPLGDTVEANNLRNKIRKNLSKVNKPVSEKAVEVWTKTVTDYASNIRAEAQYKTFSWFSNILKAEVAKSNTGGDQYTLKELEPRLKSRLDWLIATGILNSGIMFHCRHCGLKSWYTIDEIKTDNQCKGCGYEFSIKAEQRWWYRLNTLIGSNGGIYNQVPLILALGELYEKSYSSFFYHTPVDIYSSFRKGPETDLDIFAIVDGKLVIGEVKVNQQLFNDDELEKIEKAALKIRPDRVVLSAMTETPSIALQAKINEMSQRLLSKDIKVEWLEINSETLTAGLWGI